MPTPQQFMEQVVAWPGSQGPGYVNLHWKRPPVEGKDAPGMPGKPFKELHEFMDFAWYATTKNAIYSDIYFCLSTQSQTGKAFKGRLSAARGAQLALKLKAIWLDVDGYKPSEKGYGTKTEAIEAIIKFCCDAAMPAPSAIVDSGGGYHVYWIAQQPMTVAEWTPFATGLWALVKKHGLRCDNVTTDCARVLRVPGTFNRKDPKAPKVVKLMGKPEAGMPDGYDFPKDLAHLPPLGTVAKPVTAAVTQQTQPVTFDLRAFDNYKVPALLAALDPADSLSSGISLGGDRPLVIDECIKQCGHFRDCATNKGAGQGQGLWALTLLASSFFEDGEQLAHIFSKGYPSYDPAQTQAKYEEKLRYKAERNLGWPTCQAFENEGCKSCATCPLRGMINSPLKLAEKVKVPLAQQSAAFPAPPEELNLPEGFMVNSEHQICALVTQTDALTGEERPVPVPLFHHEIVPPGWAASDGLHFRYTTGNEIRDVRVPDIAMGSDMALFSNLASQLLHPQYDGRKHVSRFMTSWVSKIEAAKRRLAARPFGWVEEDGKVRGFSYAGSMYMDDGRVEQAGQPEPGFAKDFNPVGNEQFSRDVFRAICSRRHPALEIVALAGFASPLIKIPGEDAMVMWAYGEGGGHKSTSLLASLSVWGNPKKAKDNSKASLAGLYAKLNNLRNLPYVIDEVQHLEQVDALVPIINMITEGSDAARAKRDGSQRDPKDWQLLVAAGANQSIRSRLREKVPGTYASHSRVFEFEVKKRDDHLTEDMRSMVERLNTNFGGLGRLYAQHLGLNHEAIWQRGKEIEHAFKAEVGYRTEERFWSAFCTITLLAAELANSLVGENWFHYDDIHDFLVEAYMDQRSYVEQNVVSVNSRDSAEDYLSEFLKAQTDNQIWTWDMNKTAGNIQLSVARALPEGHNNPINIHWFVVDQKVRLSVAAIYRWAEIYKKGLQGDQIVRSISQQFNATRIRRCNLAAGCGLKGQAAEQCIEIDIDSRSPLYDTLRDGVGQQAPPNYLTGAQTPTGITAGAGSNLSQVLAAAGVTSSAGATGPSPV